MPRARRQGFDVSWDEWLPVDSPRIVVAADSGAERGSNPKRKREAV